MRFPRYTYDDMVRSQHEMHVDGLHVDYLRLILGTSMGCMQSFVWGETYPHFSDALAPFACLPIEIAGRNRMWRYIAMLSIRDGPAWDNGNYTHEPIEGLRGAADFLITHSSPLVLFK
jgi:homoserine O-acetyltransferase/O-succinyltransferase